MISLDLGFGHFGVKFGRFILIGASFLGIVLVLWSLLFDKEEDNDGENDDTDEDTDDDGHQDTALTAQTVGGDLNIK